MTNLPKYWAVLCPRDYETNIGWKQVIQYLETQYGHKWRGDVAGCYYGYDGGTSFKGTTYRFDPMDFHNKVTILTIEEFLSCIKNDTKWCVRGGYELSNYFRENGVRENEDLFGDNANAYYFKLDGKWTLDNIPIGRIITVKELKQMEKKIKGYKAPTDLWGGDIKKGTLFTKCTDIRNNYSVNDIAHYRIASEIVETWEPEYEEIFRIGDFVRWKGGNPTVGIIDFIIGEVCQLRDTSVDGVYDHCNIKHLEKITEDEYYKETGLIKYFGDVKFLIQKDYATTPFGAISRHEIEKMLEYIDNPPTLIGYPLIRVNDKNQSISIFDKDDIYIGCRKGTISELRNILAKMKAYESK